MIYFSEEWERNKAAITNNPKYNYTTPPLIRVRFCRDCPCFQTNYWQKDPSVVSGWCKRLSYYETMDDEEPYYVYVDSNSFCNEDDIREEDE